MWERKNCFWNSSFLFLVVANLSFAQQKQGAIWRMGNWEINFNQSPRAIYQRPGIPAKTSSETVYCDAQGRVLATTNRFDSTRNRFGQLMPSSQPVLTGWEEDTANINRVFVPDPADASQFYLFKLYKSIKSYKP